MIAKLLKALNVSKTYCCFTALFFCVLGFSNISMTKRCEFLHLSNSDGLSQNSVYRVLQDRKGFIWFSTENGLNRYDGYRFKVFSKDPSDPNSLAGSFTWHLSEDSKGRIWIGTFGTGFSKMNPKTHRFVNYIDRSNRNMRFQLNTIWAITETFDDRFWLGTFGGGMKLFDAKKGKIIHRYTKHSGKKNSLPGNDVRSILAEKNGTLWLGTFDGGLAHFNIKNNVFKQFPKSPKRIISLLKDSLHQCIWIATDGNGLWKFDLKTNHFSSCASFAGKSVRALLPDPKNKDKLWVGTWRDGLAHYNFKKDKADFYLHDPLDPTSISDNLIISLTIDRSGLLWVGTFNGGVNILNPLINRFRVFSHNGLEKNGLSPNVVYGIAETDQFLWTGTNGGGLISWNRKNNSYTDYTTTNPDKNRRLVSNVVYSLLKDGDSALWIGTGKGLQRLDRKTGKLNLFTENPKRKGSISLNQVVSGLRDQKGRLWFGTFGGGLNRYDEKTGLFTHYKNDPHHKNSLSDNTIFCLFEDSKFNFWVGTDLEGLNLMDRSKGTFKRMIHPQLGSGQHIYSMTEDRQKNLWVATTSGLVRMTPHGNGDYDITGFTLKDGIPDLFISAVVADPREGVWISSTKGISRIIPKKYPSGISVRNYGLEDGLPNLEFMSSSSHQGQSETIYFGSTAGCVGFRPKELHNRTTQPPIVITGLKIFNKSVELIPGKQRNPERVVELGENYVIGQDITSLKHLELNYDQEMLFFEFAALDYLFPKSHKFAYKMEGFDPKWNYSGANPNATYTNLDPGEYVFRVKGTNNDGIWSRNEAKIHIVILPPWWETWFFRISAALVLLLTGILIIRKRIRSLQLKNMRLEQKVAERTAEINQRNAELVQKTNELSATNRKLVQLERFKDQMTVMIVHDLKNPLNGIVNLSDKISVENNRSLIRNSARKMLYLVMNILDIQRLKDNKITLNLQTVPLNKLLTEAIDYLHIASVNKNIRVVLSPTENYDVSCDEELISRVVINLLSNAIQYSPENSEVLIHSRFMNGKIEIAIRDNGSGMSEDILHRLMEQESVSDVQNRMSTGIGLQYCFLVLAAHQTNLNIVSAPGKGTTVSFLLPAKGINPSEWITDPEIVENKRTLTEKEKEIMKPFLDRLRVCEVYEGSRILLILSEEIPDAPDWVNDWKNDVRQAVFATNELAYNQLIEQLYE